MRVTPITVDLNDYPEELRPFLTDAAIYDSSCSPEARVIRIDRDGGYFLKSAPKGTLEREADMTRYFFSKGLSQEVLQYVSGERDFLLTRRVVGEDCTDGRYLREPRRLAALLGTRLRLLHETEYEGCPVADHTSRYLQTARQNYERGVGDLSLFSGDFRFQTLDEAWREVERNGHLLKTEALLHGDYCLPNVMLDDWRFSAFIDVGNGGVGDRHVDLFWGAWTLCYNLGVDDYRADFFDAYGRDRIELDKLRLVAAAEVFG